MNRWLSNLLTTRRLARRLVLVAPVVMATSCATKSRREQGCHRPAQIKHVVAFKYRSSVTQQQKEEVMKRFLALKQECRRDGENYIVDLVGGDCTGSLEGLTEGFEQAFVVTVKDRDDYKYYVGQPFSSPFDPAHDAFKKFVTPLLSVDLDGKTNGALVLDFSTLSASDGC